MQRLNIEIAGIDFTNEAQRYGMSVQYTKREGNNGGIMMDGSLTVDILAWKAVITLPFNPMPADKQSQLMKAVANSYVMVKYFDPMENKYATKEFNADFGTTHVTLFASDGARWFEGLTIVLTER